MPLATIAHDRFFAVLFVCGYCPVPECILQDGKDAGTNRQGCPVEYEYFGGGKIKKAFPYGKAFGMNDSGNQFPAVSLFCKSCKGAEYASVSLFGATSQDGFLTA